MLSDKVNYLKGLMDGLGIDDSTKEGKILKLMAQILDEMAVTVEDISDEVDSVVDIIDMIDEDLIRVEDDLYESEDDESCDDDEEIVYDDDIEGDEHFGKYADDVEDVDLDEEAMYECCCPTCGDSITISESIVEKGSMKCPNCNTHIEFNYEEEEN